jgi:hypothetical protein
MSFLDLQLYEVLCTFAAHNLSRNQRIQESFAYRQLDDLKEFSTTMAGDINDLPATSRHGSDFGYNAQILGLASDLNATRGTVTAHRDKCCDTRFHRLDV